MKVSAPFSLAWLLLVIFETASQISLKTAGIDTGAFDFSVAAFLRAAGSVWLWIAVGCYLGAFLSWMTILRKSRLSAAFATSAIVFVTVMFSSWLVFGEHIGPLQLVGSAIIVIAILGLGHDDPAASTAHPGSR